MSDILSKIILLGTGTGIPAADRGSPAFLLDLPTVKVLIDLGPGTLRQLAAITISPADIDYILLTHLHPDHCADLVPFLFAGKYPPYLINRRPCFLLAGQNIETYYQDLTRLYGHWIGWPPGLFSVMPLPQDRTWEKDLPEFRLTSTPVEHISSSLAYRITLPDGKRLVFSGDSDYSPALVELAWKADLLVCECSFPEEEKVAGHLIPSLAGRIAREAGVEKLILTHFYPECQGRDLLGPCAREYRGPIILGEDFQTIAF